MIGHLSGTIIDTDIDHVVIGTGGVGYKVFITPDTLSQLSGETTASVWVHTAVRENAIDLYGFTEQRELSFFELLLTVSGIGPKSALGVLSAVPVETLRAAISAGEASQLTKVSGIGRKTAEKIVLELRDKVGASSSDASTTLREDAEALEALRSLGYSLSEARDALKKVSPSIETSSARLREALRVLGGN